MHNFLKIPSIKSKRCAVLGLVESLRPVSLDSSQSSLAGKTMESVIRKLQLSLRWLLCNWKVNLLLFYNLVRTLDVEIINKISFPKQCNGNFVLLWFKSPFWENMANSIDLLAQPNHNISLSLWLPLLLSSSSMLQSGWRWKWITCH